ncbi:MAG: tRNA lysidine(34) synthetase TilS [Hyphomicrobiales bacterium]|nr:tRNA lysidine(34) synthetase TilS [Hyphomicrobiales bacterium]
MARFGPFETAPRLAVAVSGGADSLALCFLAADWVRNRGGTLLVLTVDHGLRSTSAAEAEWVCNTLNEHGIPCKILTWENTKPRSGIQKKARHARYTLLLEYCRKQLIHYLLLGHQANDQAETVFMRLSRGSGLDGLAAIQPIVITPSVLILRPLLDVKEERLAATLRSRHQQWLEDPTNQDSRFLRTIVRSILRECRTYGLSCSDFSACSEKAATARDALSRAVSSLLAKCCRVTSTGMAVVEPGLLASASEEIGWRALGRIVACVGGAEWPPSPSALRRQFRSLGLTTRQPPPGTLSRCRFIRRSKGLIVCRERRNLPVSQSINAGQSIYWDGRFRLRIPASFRSSVGHLQVKPLSSAMWQEIVAQQPERRRANIPAEARYSLPAIVDQEGVFAVPNLGFIRHVRHSQTFLRAWSVFQPRRTLTGSAAFLEIAR